MWILCKLAWRNLFRHKRRTLIAGSAIGIGLAALIFIDALIIGMEERMVRSATSTFMGEGQIHREEFRTTLEVDRTINDFPSIMNRLREDPVVERFSARVLTFGMVTSPANVSACTIVGIDPERERWLSEIDDVITAGTYFEGDSERSLVIGSKMADILEVGLGDRIVITAASAGGGDLSQMMFRVSGIYHFNIAEMDKELAFIRLQTAQRMLDLDRSAHEIALKFTSTDIGGHPGNPFWERYSRDGNEAVGWTVLFPQLEVAFELSQFSILITSFILFGVVALGIINTLFMSLHERMFEFGVLRAVGTRPARMALLIVFEASSLAVVSIILGVVLGLAVTLLTERTGIDYRGIEYSGVIMRDFIYPVLTKKQFILYPLAVYCFTILTALYPAVVAARLAPADAIRRSM